MPIKLLYTGNWSNLSVSWCPSQGGIPFNTNANDNDFALEAYNQRSNRIGNPNPSSFKKNINSWFDTSAFAQPETGVFGNEKRNDMRTAGLNNLDFSLFKNLSVVENRIRVQFRAEAFNALNHPQLGAPGNQLGSGNFGVISFTQIPGRQIQLGLKVKF